MRKHWVELSVSGAQMPAYVAQPDGAARGGVVVIEEIFGVNADMQRIADLLAAERYLAIVPNLFHRTDPNFAAGHDETGIAKGLAAATSLTLEQIVADLTAAATYARGRLTPEAKIATWGFCFGGALAYFSATLPFTSAAVSFYGSMIARSPVEGRPPLLSVTPQIHAPLLLAFGGKDKSIPPESIAAIRAALEERGNVFDLRIYPDEDHGFFRQGPSGNAGSRDVWPLVLDFLAANVG